MKLLEPLKLGAVIAPNRVVFGAHETNLGRDRSISERHLAYYLSRAKGGAGVIVTEEASVHESDWPYERAPLAVDCADGWSRVSDACHNESSVVLAALNHAGGQGTSHWSQRELWAPGRVPEVNTREVPKLMEQSDIDAVVSGFGSAASIAVSAGCDGVEISAGQFSLVRQFLSGLTNTRDDQYRDRSLFAKQVIRAVRRAIGADKVISFRLSCDELAPWAGITPEMAAELAADFVADTDEARIDLLTVVRGSIFSAGSTRPDGHDAPGFNLELCRSIRSAVREVAGDRVPVVAQGSIVDTSQAEWAIEDGVADAVEMTRAQMADPNLVNKAAMGRAERIRPCVLCNQMCMVRDNRNPMVTCVVNPMSGHEFEDEPLVGTATIASEVQVVGGGAAGMESARVASIRGHTVRLFEASDSLGGELLQIAKLPGRDRFSLFADWLAAEVHELGVEVNTSMEAIPAELDSTSHVIVATGSRIGDPTYAVTKAAQVLSAGDVLAAGDPTGQEGDLPNGAVLVWDPIGGPVGIGVAELLLAAGREVHLATPDYIIGNELARAGDLGPANARLAQAGLHAHRRCSLLSVKKGTATLADRFSEELLEVPVEWVVDAGHRLPEDNLFHELAAAGFKASQAGDSVAPRTVHEAILEGRRRALDLG